VISLERPVRFEEVDAAGILFFARYFEYAHEAMERFFGALGPAADGLAAYPDLITRRRIGFPAVHLAMDCTAPLRYGDVARIDTTVAKVGRTSCAFRYLVTRAKDAVVTARIDHVVVSTDLVTMTKIPLPPEIRALLEAHLVT